VWLYHYKLDTPDSTLKTEYNLADKEDSTDENEDSNKAHLFSGDLDLVEIALPATMTVLLLVNTLWYSMKIPQQ